MIQTRDPAVEENREFTLRDSLASIPGLLENGDIEGIATRLLEAERSAQESAFAAHLGRTRAALISGCFRGVRESLEQHEIVGPDQTVLLIAPYIMQRGGVRSSKLSALVGRRICSPSGIRDFTGKLRELLGSTHPVPEEPIYSITESNTSGFWGPNVEAFILPAFFDWNDGGSPSKGAPLNLADCQRRRWDTFGRPCLHRVFETESSDYIESLLAFNTTETVATEYELHEVGHLSGLPLDRKIETGVLNPACPYGFAVEEVRADGVGLELGMRYLSAERFASVVASQLATRYGLDSHRKGKDSDWDLSVCRLEFQFHLESGELEVLTNGKLRLRNLDNEGLRRLTGPLRQFGCSLSRDELRLEDSRGIWRLFPRCSSNLASDALFEVVVRYPCLDLSGAIP